MEKEPKPIVGIENAATAEDMDEEVEDNRKFMEKQDQAEAKRERKKDKEHEDDQKIDRMIDHMEANEQAGQQKRIIDEVSDKKEEDGGDYR